MAGSDEFSVHTRAHIVINDFKETSAYQYPPRKMTHTPSRDDYVKHGQGLLKQLVEALGALPAAGADQRISLPGLQPGTIVRVDTQPLAEKARKSASKLPKQLETPGKDIVLLRTERLDDRTESALLFVPDAAREYLTGRVAGYGSNNLGNRDRPDVLVFECIEHFGATSTEDVFVGKVDFADKTPKWWELWIRAPLARADHIGNQAKQADFDVYPDRLTFPDTTVSLVHGEALKLAKFASRLPGAISEIRLASNTIETFLSLKAGKISQHAFVEELQKRTTAAPDGAPVVCALDTGVAGGHPLIEIGLAGFWAYDDDWGSDDHEPDGGHGSPMVGIILYGDLEAKLSGSSPFELTHHAESMKILPPKGFKPNDPARYGTVTQGAVAKAEVNGGQRVRTFCLAISTDLFAPDRPSSWSGALDQICAGSMPGDRGDGQAAALPKRLLLVAAGNLVEGNITEVMLGASIEDPAQSWNALTIGGYTTKDQPPAAPIGLSPVVGANQLSPYSRHSRDLANDLTPIKPEVLFEAGNMIHDATGLCSWHPSVSVVSTGSEPVAEPLVPFWATSAATAAAGHFFGHLTSELPDLWPETYRALAVQSANWTQVMKQLILPKRKGGSWKSGLSKGETQGFLRRYGYGVPDIVRALRSARNDVTLIAQQTIQPYTLNDDGKGAIYNEMHFFPLPWPKLALEELENEIITMKITLSYFPEPNLSGKAATRPETYRGYGLRFGMKKRSEDQQAFRKRITASQEGEKAEAVTEASNWLLGPKAVSAGSLHCDVWRGRAIDLAMHDEIAVYPVSGWWKSHLGQKRAQDTGRYALLISIDASGHAIDLYSEIENIVAVKQAVLV